MSMLIPLLPFLYMVWYFESYLRITFNYKKKIITFPMICLNFELIIFFPQRPYKKQTSKYVLLSLFYINKDLSLVTRKVCIKCCITNTLLSISESNAINLRNKLTLYVYIIYFHGTMNKRYAALTQ